MSGRITALTLALGVLAGGFALATDLEVRVFTLKYRDPAEASQAVQPLLSESGSLTVQPKVRRLSVQDRPEVVERIAEFLAGYDVPPPAFHLRLLLLRASAAPAPKDAEGKLDLDLLRRLRRMFRYASYVPLGSAEVHGSAGDEVSVALDGGYRVAFRSGAFQRVPVPLQRPRKAVAIPTPTKRRAVRPPLRPVRRTTEVAQRPRLRLEHLQLLREVPGGKNVVKLEEILRTSVIISSGQRVVLGAASSESAGQALVLVIQAVEPKGEGR